MSINLTLLIQIINFIVAYALITRLLLKPFLVAKKKQNKQDSAISKRYDESFKQLCDAQTHKDNEWYKASKILATMIPTFEDNVCTGNKRNDQSNLISYEATTISDHDVEYTTRILIKKIQKAY